MYWWWFVLFTEQAMKPNFMAMASWNKTNLLPHVSSGNSEK